MEVIARNGDTLSYYSRLFMIPLQLLADSNQQSAKDALKKAIAFIFQAFNQKHFN